jgi:hypothetical protein
MFFIHIYILYIKHVIKSKVNFNKITLSLGNPNVLLWLNNHSVLFYIWFSVRIKNMEVSVEIQNEFQFLNNVEQLIIKKLNMIKMKCINNNIYIPIAI